MNDNDLKIFVIFLRFGPNRAQAGQWMAEHRQWIETGIADGCFLMAGSLDEGQGGMVLAAARVRAEIEARLAQDPFVIHDVVTVQIHTAEPAFMADGMATLIQSGGIAEPQS